MMHLTLNDLHNKFKEQTELGNVKHYKKFGVFSVRQAEVGEKVETIIDGKKETQNVAKAGSWVLTGANKEQYVIGNDIFKKRYELRADGTALAKGECWAYQVGKNEEPFTFTAEWNEDMIAEPGDMIASVEKSGKNPYRIEKTAFDKSYKLVS